MGILVLVVGIVLNIFLVMLIARMIISWIQAYARDWHPTGVVLIIAESIFTVSDPPLKFLGRYIRPIRIGRVSLDLSFTVLFIVIVAILVVIGAPVL
jgi:YggT family protein